MAFTFIDLFSGIGGFRLALSNLGGTCLNFSEIAKDAIDVYCSNFREDKTYNLGDITKVSNLPKHDLLTAGVPCQSWSIAGRNLGFDDDRGQLWNDTIYLLHKARPKAFIFENVKGLVDPRNEIALTYILQRIKGAGYTASYYVLNSFDYGVPQNRVRIYIIGFLDPSFHARFRIPQPLEHKIRLGDILEGYQKTFSPTRPITQTDLFGEMVGRNMALSNNNGFNDYFLFNDLRNGHSTIHSWDIIETTEHQKHICYLLLRNRRKSKYGELDGNPLSLCHFQALDKSVLQSDLDGLVNLGILKAEEYSFSVEKVVEGFISEEEKSILECAALNALNIDTLKNNRALKLKKINIIKNIQSLILKGVLKCNEIRYDFKNTKISTGLNGINRIFLPSSSVFPTLVASDSNDFISIEDVSASNEKEYKEKFIQTIFRQKKYRKITKEEACLVQGFPKKFILPDGRSRWMKLLGNSVSPPVIEILGKAIIKTGVFDSVTNQQVPQTVQNQVHF